LAADEAACWAGNFIGTAFSPIVGTWETSVILTLTRTYNSNGTFTETEMLGDLGTIRDGTWTSTSTTITKTYSDDSVSSFTYSFNADKTEMTLSAIPDGMAITYIKQ